MANTTEQFIEKAHLKHNFKYDYSKTVYKRCDDKVTIICPIHGEFLQTPKIHLKSECFLCGKSKSTKSRTFSTQQFIEKANKVHNNLYLYSRSTYINSNSKIIITCKIHGDFEQVPSSHLSKHGCSRCKSEVIRKNFTKDLSNFIQRSNKIHNFKYNYSKTVYTKSNKYLNIICPIHGEFSQEANCHTSGSGCPSCAKELKGWNRTNFKKHCNKNNNGLGIFYIIRCFNETEIFYKIGITSRSIKERYSDDIAMPYQYEIIQEILGQPELIYNLEKLLKEYYKNNSYKPLLFFCGITECYVSNQ